MINRYFVMEITSPNIIPNIDATFVFLGGAIDNGSALNWQKEVSLKLQAYHRIIVLNPRRESFCFTDKPELEKQIEWELNAQELSHIILYYFPEHSMAPITFLELGTFSQRCPDKIIVCAELGFYRLTNLEVFCKRYNIKLVNNLDQFLSIVYLKMSESL